MVSTTRAKCWVLAEALIMSVMTYRFLQGNRPWCPGFWLAQNTSLQRGLNRSVVGSLSSDLLQASSIGNFSRSWNPLFTLYYLVDLFISFKEYAFIAKDIFIEYMCILCSINKAGDKSGEPRWEWFPRKNSGGDSSRWFNHSIQRNLDNS